ncbi:FecCD family ABC transporter permease [Gracilinema caldarium]|uniref:ABC-type transporter, integral membrane subunit n=1 Tax=Gracilinema caldarium (strain ATCC 51460 / DSM 7334 / H1) TaxID=744872 RepID=F8F0K9_GRAC1|nr:iron ABC transporter permease [Gracilinema caldarium]AEJ19353.1 ABC-type transporter, integral membrane subunit [Gracilinema caldarium DSM 7334]
MPRRRYLSIILLLFIVLCFTALYGVAAGAVTIPLREIVGAMSVLFSHEQKDTNFTILFYLRLPRVLLAMAVGASLSVAGAGFQGFFRNPLADPYVIGASSGAALGAALAIVLSLPSAGPVSSISLCAFLGALMATFLAFGLSRFAGDPPPSVALLLAGTALSAFFSALLSLVLVLKDKDMHRVYYWLLGGLGMSSWTELVTMVPIMILGAGLVYLASRPLDILIQGDDVAHSLGIDVRRLRFLVATGASLAAAAAVASAGIIGFVGLIAPHAMRIIVGPSHRRLLPAAALGGALLVLVADIVARRIAAPLELPIGIITSIIGAPFFILLLFKRGRHLGS